MNFMYCLTNIEMFIYMMANLLLSLQLFYFMIKDQNSNINKITSLLSNRKYSIHIQQFQIKKIVEGDKKRTFSETENIDDSLMYIPPNKKQKSKADAAAKRNYYQLVCFFQIITITFRATILCSGTDSSQKN